MHSCFVEVFGLEEVAYGLLEVVEGFLVEGLVVGRECAQDGVFGSWREFFEDHVFGSSEDEWLDVVAECFQCTCGVAGCSAFFDFLFCAQEEFGEYAVCSEYAGHEQRQLCPEVVEGVFNGCSGECEFELGVDLEEGLSGFGCPLFDHC